MPGASRFWTRKDSDLVSQHVDMPLEYIKKTLEEKQLHRDQTEAGLLNDDYKMPKNIAWSPEQTAAVDAYNERKKNERLKIQEQFYNSPIDNTNQVASQLLTNRRKTSDEWKEGTGEAWNYQRQYDEYANYAENQKKRLAGKEVTEEDIKLDDYLTRQNFNTKYKGDNYKKAPLNKISVEGVNTSSFADASPIVEKTIAQWKENNHIQEQRDGTFINTDTQEYVPYSDVVKGIQGALAGSNELQSYVRYKGQQSADLLKYQKLDPEQKEQMKNSLRNVSNSLLEGASENDYTDNVYQKAIDPKTGKFSKEIFDEQRKNDMRYKEGELDKMSDEDLVKEYQKHKLIDLPTIEGGMKASYKKTSRQKTQDQLAVQTIAHQSNSQYDKRVAKEEQEEERRNGIQTNYVGMLGINGKDMPDIDELLKSDDNVKRLLGIMGEGISGQTWNMTAGKDKSGMKSNVDKLRQFLRSPAGEAKIKEVVHNLTTNFDGAENVFGNNEQEFNQKFEDYINNSKEKFTSMGESMLGFLKAGAKTYNKDREENGWNKIEVADIQNSKITEEIHDQFLGKSVSNFTKDDAPDKLLIGLKRFPGGEAENKLYTYTEGEGKDKVTYSHKPYKDMIEALYHTGNYDVNDQLYKNNTQVRGMSSTGNKKMAGLGNNDSDVAGGQVWSVRSGNRSNVPVIAEGTKESKAYANEFSDIHNGIGIGKKTKEKPITDYNTSGTLTIPGIDRNHDIDVTGNVYTIEKEVYVSKNNPKMIYFKKPEGGDYVKKTAPIMYSDDDKPLYEHAGYGVTNEKGETIGYQANNIRDEFVATADKNNRFLNNTSSTSLTSNNMNKMDNTTKVKNSSYSSNASGSKKTGAPIYDDKGKLIGYSTP